MSDEPTTPPEEGTEEQEQQQPSQIVKESGPLPCGCFKTVFSDERAEIKPCPPHALMEAARMFMRAGDLLGACGAKLLEAQNAQVMEQVARAMSKPGKGKKGIKGVVK